MPSILSPEALTSLQAFKEALNISVNDQTRDNRLERCINRATSWIQHVTNRKLLARRYNGGSSKLGNIPDEAQVVFDGNPDIHQDIPTHKGLFYLPQYPVLPNATLAFKLEQLSSRDQSGEVWDSTALLELRDYIVDRERGAIRLTGRQFEEGISNYRVTFAAGFTTVPADLEDLCIEVAKQMYGVARNVLSENFAGSWQKQFRDGPDPIFAATLQNYSRPIVV